MKDDRVYLRHILRCTSGIQQYTAAGCDSFFSSPLIQDGSIRNLQTMAESTRRLSDSSGLGDPTWTGMRSPDSAMSLFTTTWALTSSSFTE